jgi:hypothetical protein
MASIDVFSFDQGFTFMADQIAGSIVRLGYPYFLGLSTFIDSIPTDLDEIRSLWDPSKTKKWGTIPKRTNSPVFFIPDSGILQAEPVECLFDLIVFDVRCALAPFSPLWSDIHMH